VGRLDDVSKLLDSIKKEQDDAAERLQKLMEAHSDEMIHKEEEQVVPIDPKPASNEITLSEITSNEITPAAITSNEITSTEIAANDSESKGLYEKYLEMVEAPVKSSSRNSATEKLPDTNTEASNSNVNGTSMEHSFSIQNLNRQQLDNAATKVQSSFRGYHARKEQKKQKEAATIVQANIRGYLTRKEFKKQKVEKNSVAEDEEFEEMRKSTTVNQNKDSIKTEENSEIEEPSLKPQQPIDNVSSHDQSDTHNQSVIQNPIKVSHQIQEVQNDIQNTVEVSPQIQKAQSDVQSILESSPITHTAQSVVQNQLEFSAQIPKEIPIELKMLPEKYDPSSTKVSTPSKSKVAEKNSSSSALPLKDESPKLDETKANTNKDGNVKPDSTKPSKSERKPMKTNSASAKKPSKPNQSGEYQYDQEEGNNGSIADKLPEISGEKIILEKRRVSNALTDGPELLEKLKTLALEDVTVSDSIENVILPNQKSSLPPISSANKPVTADYESNHPNSVSDQGQSHPRSAGLNKKLNRGVKRNTVKLSGFEFRRDPVVEALAEQLSDREYKYFLSSSIYLS
jgi:hypothetical protein